MTTLRVRDIPQGTKADDAGRDVPSALEFLARDAQGAKADDAVVDLSDPVGILRHRESNGGHLQNERPRAEDEQNGAPAKQQEVIDLSDPHAVVAARSQGGTR
jgi:hypothetical protein